MPQEWREVGGGTPNGPSQGRPWQTLSPPLPTPHTKAAAVLHCTTAASPMEANNISSLQGLQAPLSLSTAQLAFLKQALPGIT